MDSIATVTLLIITSHFCGGIQFQDDPIIERFREYLRIDTAHPDPAGKYLPGIEWITNQSVEIGLNYTLVYLEERPPYQNGHAFWLTWPGRNPALKSILINTHMDVVAAVDEGKWGNPPFEAFMDENGDIYGRGTIDMKSATVGALEAIRVLKSEGFEPLRTIHLTIMPDEEVGGHHGMEPFVNSVHFERLNVGLDIDECEINNGSVLLISNAEKAIWQFNITANGTAAHASTLPADTAAGKLQLAINKLLQYRTEQLDEVNTNPNVSVADVTTINLVKMGGGLGDNIIPDLLWASFDMRILIKPDWDFSHVENFLNAIITEAGVDIKWIQKSEHDGVTPTEGNVWWEEIMRACNQLNLTCAPQVISGATDGRYVRSKGIPVFGIHPFLNTEKLQHQHNEKINAVEYLAGIPRFTQIIRNVASLPENENIDT